MSKKTNEQPWLFNKGNIIFAVVSLCLIGGMVYFINATNQTKAKDETIAKQLSKEQSKLDKVLAYNSKTIYLPKAGDIQLSSSQIASVKWLSSFFTQATTYDNITAYKTNYNYAQEHIHDKSFYKAFMANPGEITALQLKSKNVRTQVLVTGPTSYRVIVNYIPYHNDSDLYQINKLNATVQIFDVQGIAGNYQHMKASSEFRTNGRTIAMNLFDD